MGGGREPRLFMIAVSLIAGKTKLSCTQLITIQRFTENLVMEKHKTDCHKNDGSAKTALTYILKESHKTDYILTVHFT